MLRKVNNTSGFATLFIPIIILISGLVILGYIMIIQGNSTRGTPQIIEAINRTVNNPTPTPINFPFQDMTIPYLRSRQYVSTLGPLTKISENADFTTYVTSYDSDGLKINGLLTIPKGDPLQSSVGEVGWPAIVFVHGYIPPEVYRTQVNYLSYVNSLAREKFVVFKIDLRGHDDSEGEAGGGYYSGDYVIDTLNAYAALQSTDFVNPKRIGLWGHSMAGNVLFRSLVAAKNIPATVIWAGAGYTYSDLQDYMIEDNSYRPPPVNSERAKKRQELRDTYGSFDSNHWFWKQVTPVNYVEGVTGAIQLNHAVNDNVVSIDYSRNLMQVLDNSTIVHELNEYLNGGHNLEGSTFTSAMQKSISFFEHHL